ncbi:GIT1 protein, partial [Corythaixoides concolor]|nr:GIT1 protein [Corythaixoides concolor]
PTKSEFIRAKYQMLAFVHKLPCRDDDGVTAKDLSKQLHSSVRTGNLETCLRLLSLGAQANFFHPEKGTTPLHVAAKAGQILQAELLVVYGADPGAPDVNGRTPIDYARQAAQHELAERLVECQYELTDRLAFYLCGRKPGERGGPGERGLPRWGARDPADHPSLWADHKNGHYIIPQMADRVRPKCMAQSLDLSELAKAAKKKLQALSNHLFEELAMDVYDEVDRRENDAVWLTTQNHSTLVTERSAVPFLPVNPEYSATRNQGRQKLARFNAREFATLLIDILGEAKRRQQGKSLLSPTGEGWGAAENTQIRQQTGPTHPTPAPSERPEHGHPPGTAPPHRRDRQAFSMYEPGSALKPFGQPVEELVTRLQPFGAGVSAEGWVVFGVQRPPPAPQGAGSHPRGAVTFRVSPGGGGRGSVLHAHPGQRVPGKGAVAGAAPAWDVAAVALPGRGRCAVLGRPPAALHPPGSGRGPLRGTAATGRSCMQGGGDLCARPPLHVTGIRKGPSVSSVPFPPSSPLLSCPPDGARHMSKLDRHGSGTDSDYDNTQASEVLISMEGKRFVELSKDEEFPHELDPLDGELDPGLPSTEDVILKTEQVTKNIQELLRAAQESKHDSFVPCSEKIHSAVTEMASLFPKKPALETVRSSLRLLNASAYRLQSECRKTVPPEPGAAVDYQLLTQQVIQCAYDIAKAAKQLVTITTREKKQ